MVGKRLLVLHGLWGRARGLLLWAEDSGRTMTSRSQALRSARRHPFAADHEQLAAILADTGDDLDPVVLQLPSTAKSPLDSPEMVRLAPRRGARNEPGLLRWSVPVAVLAPARALAWLSNPDRQVDDVREGASIRYLTELADLAVDLVAAGRVLPTALIQPADRGGPGLKHPESEANDRSSNDLTSAIARWRPVLTGPDLLVFQALVNTMPPVCRAEVLPMSEPNAQVMGAEPYELAQDALAVLVDCAARASLADMSLLPPRRGRAPRTQPAAEAWIQALQSPDGHFVAVPQEFAELERQLAAWDEVGAPRPGAAHAVFRLAEIGTDHDVLIDSGLPAGDDAGLDTASLPNPLLDPADAAAQAGDRTTAGGTKWRVEFLLQSAVDPSLLVAAPQVWEDDGALQRWLDHPSELLLAELGRASRIYPALAGGLRAAKPVAMDLASDGAYDFLSRAAPRLEEAGFGVQLPSWWDHRPSLGLKASASTPSDAQSEGGSLGRDQLCDFQWRLAIGDQELTDDEIEALAAAKAPLIQFRGQWVTINPDRLKRGLEILREAGPGHKTVSEVLSLAALGAGADELPLDITAVEADGWLGELLAGTVPRAFEVVDAPDQFCTRLRPYQQRGLSWLAFLSRIGLGACLADDMGLGKTVQLLALEALERSGGAPGSGGGDPDESGSALSAPGSGAPEHRPTLLLCPMSLVGNWQREAAKFAPGLRVYAHHGPGRASGEHLGELLTTTDLVVTTYGTALRDLEELEAVEWRRVVLDEAQAVKNSLSQSAKAVRRLKADHRIALTGTPVENRLSELWSIMDFLNPGLLGSSELFRTRFAIPVERYHDVHAAEKLRGVTRPYVLRRLKTDPAIAGDLPEKIETKQYCRLTVEQASLYQAVVGEMMRKIEIAEGIERHGQVLATMTKLKQICNHPAQLLHDGTAIGARSGKVARLEEILDEITAEGDRVLCFTQFTEFAEMLLPHLAARFGADIAYLHGKTPKAKRDEMVSLFQSGDGPQIFLLSLRAGGTGLTLTAANHVIHLDRWWNPAVENQATDRAFRIGQKRNVQVHKFICTGTLEERIDDMITEKQALADLVVADGEQWLTRLSTGELRELFTLSAEAVGE